MPITQDLTVANSKAGACWITIDRPSKHNALARSVLAGLADAVEAAGTSGHAKVIVLTGAGERFFAAGGDLLDLASVRDEAATLLMTDEARQSLDTLRRCPIPVIAYLNGDAIGGGAELALACDMRLQASHARIGFVQARLAITSAWGGGPDLCRLVGGPTAMRMMSRCELVNAPQALALGLADAVITQGAAEGELLAFLEPMLACPPQVLRGIKAQTLAWRCGESYEASRAIEQKELMKTWLHDDHWSASENLLSKGKK